MVLNASSKISNEATEDHGLDDFDDEVENLGVSDMADRINAQNAALNPGHRGGVRGLFLSARGWAALRLPGGRPGERMEFWNSLGSFIPFWSGTTIRDSPYRQMITANMWQRYINNMDPLDDALEINAPYSPEEALSLRAFCEEWGTIDPGHVAFRQRLINHPSTNEADAILKGNMVYDICTRQIRLRTTPDDGRRGGNNPIPIRLAHDILTSIPFREFNYYTLNSVHAEEGPGLYRDFLSRYIRLTATEVSMVEEIEDGIRAGGRGYATMSTSLTGDAAEAYAIMQQTVEAMELGDTVTVRANLNALLAAPYNYASSAMNINVSGPHGGNFVAKNALVFVKIKEGALKEKTQKNGNMAAMYKYGRNSAGVQVEMPGPSNSGAIKDSTPEGYYAEVNDNGIGIKRIYEVLKIDNNKSIRIVGRDREALALNNLIGGFNAFDERAVDGRAGDGERPRRAAGRDRRPRDNPGVRSNRFGGEGTMGRGSFIQVQLLPKTQVEFTGKHKGKKNATQFWEQGGTKVSDSTGLAGVFSGGPSNDGYFIKTAVHKRTGKPVPWLIALPRKSFEAFTDSEGRRTVRPKHRKAEANPAWEKFTSLYGVPTYSGGKGTKNLFKIKKADRGTFYSKLRATPTKK